ncbi:MAG: DinB family protein [Roseiflexaceae bacterium]
MSGQNIIRTLMEYHVASNRRLWDHLMEHMTDEQFTQVLSYSRGSIRHQVVHLAATDRYWLHDIQVKPVTGLEPGEYPTRASFTATWEGIEQALLEYVQSLTDADLIAVPDGLLETRWMALVHIANHGTDHRAQILSMLHSLGVPTFAQDFADHLRAERWVSVADVLGLIRLRRGVWEQVLASIPRERMAEIVSGAYSIKDIVAHLTWYDREMVGVLTARKLAGSEWWDLSTDERNQQIFDQHRGQPLDAVLQEHDQVHRALITQIERLDDQDLNDPSRISEMLPGWKLWALLEGNTWIHYLAHTEMLWAWLDRSGSQRP